MAASIPHIYIMYLRYQLYLSAQVSDGGPSVGHVLVKHFTPLTLGPHTLGGICYTVIFTVLTIPHPTQWRTHSVTCEHCHALRSPSMHPSECEWYFPLRHLLAKITKNIPFCIGAGSQFRTRATEENPTQRSRHLALCHRAAIAPPILGIVF